MSDTTEIITAENDGSLTAKTIVYVNSDGTFTQEGKERAMRLLKGIGFDFEKFISNVLRHESIDRIDSDVFNDVAKAVNTLNMSEIISLSENFTEEKRAAYLMGVLHSLIFLQENIKP